MATASRSLVRLPGQSSGKNTRRMPHKQHTAFSQMCESVYPEGTTREEVEMRVRGSFGGRFVYFVDGKFKYIAYTY